MPRTGRGGARQGTPGQSYGNRTDLNQPIKTGPPSEYGQGVALQNAQKVVPLPNNAAQTQANIQGATSPQQQVQQNQAVGNQPPMPTAPQGPLPGSITSLSAPSEQPTVPVTHGSPTGPGAGPEALQQTALPTNRMSTMLQAVANASGSNAMATLAQRAQSLGQ